MTQPSRAEQRKLEALWAASARVYGEARRRQNVAEWAAHHERLAGAFRAHADRHEEERRRYELLLQAMFTNQGDRDERVPA